MNVKLKQSLAGDRFSFAPRQVIRCSDVTGARLIEQGIAVEVDEDADAEGELFDASAEERLAAEQKAARRAQPEKAVKPKPETPEAGAPAICQGTTGMGNPCKKAALPGSKFCAKHQG